jgi:hypothetical protein
LYDLLSHCTVLVAHSILFDTLIRGQGGGTEVDSAGSVRRPRIVVVHCRIVAVSHGSHPVWNSASAVTGTEYPSAGIDAERQHKLDQLGGGRRVIQKG